MTEPKRPPPRQERPKKCYDLENTLVGFVTFMGISLRKVPVSETNFQVTHLLTKGKADDAVREIHRGNVFEEMKKLVSPKGDIRTSHLMVSSVRTLLGVASNPGPRPPDVCFKALAGLVSRVRRKFDSDSDYRRHCKATMVGRSLRLGERILRDHFLFTAPNSPPGWEFHTPQ